MTSYTFDLEANYGPESQAFQTLAETHQQGFGCTPEQLTQGCSNTVDSLGNPWRCQCPTGSTSTTSYNHVIYPSS